VIMGVCVAVCMAMAHMHPESGGRLAVLTLWEGINEIASCRMVDV